MLIHVVLQMFDKLQAAESFVMRMRWRAFGGPEVSNGETSAF